MTAQNRVAVVTGGASGIGLAIVRHLADEGMSLVAADWSAEACASAAETLAAYGGRVRVEQADIATPAGAQQVTGAAIAAFGRLDLLCNNAALHPLALIEDHPLESWRETFRVNVDGPMLCSQAALPHMKRQKSGAIVNIGSNSGLVPYATGGAYATSKAALVMLTKVLALEVGPYGVTVNCICPGSIRHRSGGEEPSASHIPVGRVGVPSDVAHLVSYLASDAAGYMTGAVIMLDGGATAGRARVSSRKPAPPANR
jgi:3-oxoacyl-[acyl-carrier protein] reductase